MPLQVSVCIIVKNEATCLAKCLSSVEAIAAELIVVDTGSSDESVAIAKTYTPKVYSYQWHDDFAAARNFAIEHASCEWILFIDADETLSFDKQILNISPSKNTGGYVFAREDQYIDLESGKEDAYIVGVVRLFRNVTSIRYQYSIHEEVHSSIIAAGYAIEVTDALFLHHQVKALTADQLHKKQSNYLDMMDQALTDRPDDPWLLYHRAKTYWFFGNTEAAYAVFHRVTSLAEDHYLLAAAWNQLATLHMNQGSFDQALSLLSNSLELVSNQSVGYVILHDILFQQEKYEEAQKALQQVKTNLEDTTWSDVIAGDFYHHPNLVRYKKGCLYMAMGDIEKGLRVLELGTLPAKNSDKSPQSHQSDCLYALALYHAKAGNETKAHTLIKECLTIDPGWLQAQVLAEYLSDKSASP